MVNVQGIAEAGKWLSKNKANCRLTPVVVSCFWTVTPLSLFCKVSIIVTFIYKIN